MTNIKSPYKQRLKYRETHNTTLRRVYEYSTTKYRGRHATQFVDGGQAYTYGSFKDAVERLSQRTVALVSKRLIVETKDGKTFEFTVYNIAQWLEKGNRALAGEFGSLEVSAPAPQAAPAGPAPSGSYVAELKQLKELLDAGIITEEEFKIKKRQVLHI